METPCAHLEGPVALVFVVLDVQTYYVLESVQGQGLGWRGTRGITKSAS